MRVLFIKLKNIGDTLIMTPALTAARQLWPNAVIDVLVRKSTEGILRGSLALDNIYTSAEPEAKKRISWQWLEDLKLIGELKKHKYDWIFELSDNDRGRLMAFAIGAKNIASHTHHKFPFWAHAFIKHQSKCDYNAIHRCQKDVELLRAFCGYAGDTPAMEFDRSFAEWEWAQSHLAAAPIVIHPATRWKRKMWTVEKWRDLVGRLGKIAPIVVTSGKAPEEVATAKQIADAAPEGRAIVTEGKLNWPQMAGLLYSARLIVTVDTATMHLAAACGLPIVALWGPTSEVEWAPWKARSQLVHPANPPALREDRRAYDIEVDPVWDACLVFLKDNPPK